MTNAVKKGGGGELPELVFRLDPDKLDIDGALFGPNLDPGGMLWEDHRDSSRIPEPHDSIQGFLDQAVERRIRFEAQDSLPFSKCTPILRSLRDGHRTGLKFAMGDEGRISATLQAHPSDLQWFSWDRSTDSFHVLIAFEDGLTLLSDTARIQANDICNAFGNRLPWDTIIERIVSPAKVVGGKRMLIVPIYRGSVLLYGDFHRLLSRLEASNRQRPLKDSLPIVVDLGEDAIFCRGDFLTDFASDSGLIGE